MTEAGQMHTPSPWAVNPLNAQVDAFDGAVCQLLWPTELRSEAETEANARLIAAAPDLLEALRQMVQAFDITSDHFEEVEVDGEMIDPSDLLDLARTALAKATATESK